MITANGCRGDWVGGNTATLYLDPDFSASTLLWKSDTSLEFRVWPHISRHPVRLCESCCHWLGLVRKVAASISWDVGGLSTWCQYFEGTKWNLLTTQCCFPLPFSPVWSWSVTSWPVRSQRCSAIISWWVCLLTDFYLWFYSSSKCWRL